MGIRRSGRVNGEPGDFPHRPRWVRHLTAAGQHHARAAIEIRMSILCEPLFRLAAKRFVQQRARVRWPSAWA